MVAVVQSESLPDLEVANADYNHSGSNYISCISSREHMTSPSSAAAMERKVKTTDRGDLKSMPEQIKRPSRFCQPILGDSRPA